MKSAEIENLDSTDKSISLYSEKLSFTGQSFQSHK